MSQWLKNLVMVIVLLAWLAFCATQLARGREVPLPVWSVPGATYALLSNKLPKVNLSSDKEKEE